MIIDGIDLSVVGLTVHDMSGHLDAPARGWELASVPARVDSPLMSPEGTVEPRRIQIEAIQKAVSLAVLRSYRDQLLGILNNGLLEIQIPSMPGKVIYGRVEPVTLPPIKPIFIQRGHNVRIVILCSDPLYYEVTEQVVALSSSPASVPMGSASLRPVVEIEGPATDPILIYRDADGVEVSRMSFSGVILMSGERLIIDAKELTIVNGNGDNRADALATGTSRWLRLSPYEATSLLGPWPTLELTSGTGEVRYRKAYL